MQEILLFTFSECNVLICIISESYGHTVSLVDAYAFTIAQC